MDEKNNKENIIDLTDHTNPIECFTWPYLLFKLKESETKTLTMSENDGWEVIIALLEPPADNFSWEDYDDYSKRDLVNYYLEALWELRKMKTKYEQARNGYITEEKGTLACWTDGCPNGTIAWFRTATGRGGTCEKCGRRYSLLPTISGIGMEEI